MIFKERRTVPLYLVYIYPYERKAGLELGISTKIGCGYEGVRTHKTLLVRYFMLLKSWKWTPWCSDQDPRFLYVRSFV